MNIITFFLAQNHNGVHDGSVRPGGVASVQGRGSATLFFASRIFRFWRVFPPDWTGDNFPQTGFQARMGLRWQWAGIATGVVVAVNGGCRLFQSSGVGGGGSGGGEREGRRLR